MQYSEESLLSSFKVSKKSHFAIAAGYGCTGAFERMINILSIPLSSKGLLQPVVFITPYEHHSNILPWVERGCKVIMLESDRFGNINY
jgi:selenocysteine lyase/cysteine desulfurase